MKANFLKDKKFWYIIGAVVVIIGGVVLFVLYKRKKAAESLGLASSPGGSSVNSSSASQSTKPVMYNSSAFPLKNGSRGSEVLTLQRYLNNGVLANQQKNGIVAPLAKLIEDGIWGPKTEEAVSTKLGLSSINETYYKTIILGQL